MFEFLKRNKIQLAEKPSSQPASQKARFSKRIVVTKPSRIELEMENLKTAVAVAENSQKPDRRLILGIYKQILKDAHLLSQIRTAHNAILQSEFKIVDENGKELADKKKFFERSWFTDFIAYSIDSEFYGHSLIELALKDENGFSQCDLIPRFHVIPNTGEVVINYDNELKINYRNNLTALGLIEVGSHEDLGLLEIAAREVIWKLYSRTDWSLRSEKFGMPLLAIETETVDDKELDEIEEMASNFGTNGYVIVNKGDKISLESPTNTGNSHTIYKDSIETCNEEISKLINGQTMTSDNGSSLSQSEVHERILNSYTLARLEKVQREVNDKLIPYLVENGYQLQGSRLQYLDLEKQDPKQVAPTEQTKTNTTEKKKLSHKQIANFKNSLSLVYDGQNIELGLFKGIGLSIFNKVMERIHGLALKNNLPPDDKLVLEAKELVAETYSQLAKAFDEGIKLSKYTPDKVFLKKLKTGLWQFSGIKTQAQLLEATALLFDDKGEVKAWNKFRDDILTIHQNYNVNYLRSEYDHTIASSQAASKWQQHEENKELIYLQYRTAGDERVRASHQAMNDITLPVEDPFWDSFYIPNGWGCRCNVVEVLRTRYKATDSKKATEAGEASMIVLNNDGTINEKATAKNQIFKFNPGKQEQIFPKGHPYYDLANKKINKSIDGLK